MKYFKFLSLLTTGLFVTTLFGCAAKTNEYQPPPPPEVKVARPIQTTITLFIEENGETEAVERAVVRAQVGGILQEIKFEPAAPVQQGDVLFQIEPDDYQATKNASEASLSASKAAVKVAEASIKTAQAEVDRTTALYKREEDLFKKGVTTATTYEKALADRDSAVAYFDAAQATLDEAKASVQRSEADLKQANLDLRRTNVLAPISGQISKTNIKLGNLIENGSELATIVDRDPIYANFNISDRDLLRLEKQQNTEASRQNRKERGFTDIPVFLKRELDDGFPFQGNLNYIDQEGVDQGTGTLSLRAIFDNPDDRILPGYFVRVRVPIGKVEDAILIPEGAIGRDQLSKYVLTVNEESKVVRKNIVTGPKYGDYLVVESGLEASDRIIIEGLQKARPDNPVTIPEDGEITLEAPADVMEHVESLSPEKSGPVDAESAEEPIELPAAEE